MSIGSKFNLMALGIPIVGLLILLGLIYVYAPSVIQAFLVLVGGFLALDGVVWNKLRSQLETKTHQVWDNYLKPIRDTVGEVVVSAYFFPDRTRGLESKTEWVSKYGKYGLVRLYPNTLVKLKLVPTLLTTGEDFNSKLNLIWDDAKANGLEISIFYYAFDRWGLRKIPPEHTKGLPSLVLVKQDNYLATLDKTKKKEIADLTQSWKRAFGLADQIVSLLDRFSSENGIMPPKPTNPFETYSFR